MKKSILRNFVVVALLLGLLFAAMPTQQAQAAADTSWYDSNLDSFTLTTVDQLEGLDELLNGGTTFAGKTILLGTDINLYGQSFFPLGSYANPFKGTFDGDNYKLSNLSLTQTTNYVGFFASVVGGSVKNLKIDNFNIKGPQFVGGVAGQIFTADFDNIHVSNSTIECDHFGGGVTGYLYGSARNSSATSVTVKAHNEVPGELGNKLGAIAGYVGETNTNSYFLENNTGTNVTVIGLRDIGGLFGAAQYGVSVFNNTITDSTVTATNQHGSHPDPWAGGIVGRLPNPSVTLRGNVNNNTTVTSYVADHAGPIYGGPAANANDERVYNQTQQTWHPSISAAITAANDNDALFASPGIYPENIVINKKITLNGPDVDSAFGDTPATVQGTITINSSNVTINDLKVSPGNVNGQVAAIYVAGSNVTLQRNLIDGMYGDSTGTIKGIHLYSAATDGITTFTIDHNVIRNINNPVNPQPDHTNKGSSGIMVQGVVKNVTISNNTVENVSSKGWAYGIEVTPTSNPANAIPQNVSITGNTITNITATTYPGVGLSIDQVNDNYTADASQVVVLNNKFLDSPVVNKDKNHTLNATHNYWGSADGPSGEDLYGKIKFFPFWIDPEMTQLSQVPETTLAMDPVTLEACEIGLGDYIVSVNVGPVYDLSAYQIKVSFDPAKLEVLDLINGDVLIGNAAEIKILGNDTGVLDYSRALYGNPDGWNLIDDPDGGTLMKIKVKTKAAGTSVMELLNTSILSRTDNAQHHPYDITNAKTTVTTSLYAVRNGAKSYCDLQTAVDEAIPGDTLTVLRDFTVAAPVQVAKEITFNTAGYTVTRTGATSVYDSLFEVQTGGNLSITGGGTLNSTDTDGATTGTLGAALRILGGEATLVDATLKGDYVGVRVQGNNNPTTWETPTPAVFKMTGGTAYNIVVVGNGGKLDLSGGTVTSAGVYAAIQGSGTVNATYNQGGTEIIIRDNVLVTRPDDDIVIYHPQRGKLTINGGTITGDSPIYMKSGELTVTAGTITATGAFVAEPVLHSSGAYPTGDAIFILNQNGYKGDIKLKITGGTITSNNGYAVREFTAIDEETGNPHETRTKSIDISGGKFTGGTGANKAVTFATTAADILKLTGGAYNVDPAAFVYFPLETFKDTETDNYYRIRDMWPVENTDTGVIYKTLALAIAGAQPGQTLQARRDFNTTGAVGVNMTITFDTNGKTVTRTDPTSVYSSLFQVMETGNLTIKGTGTVISTDEDETLGTAVKTYGGTVNLEGATLSGGYASVAVYEQWGQNIPDPTPGIFNMSSGMTTDGIIVEDEGSQLNISGGTVKTTKNQFAIAGFGDGASGTIINISGDAKVISEQAVAIFHPQEGTLTISGNASITGPSAIQMKSGDLIISGTPTITATGAFVATPDPTGDGAQNTGDAIFAFSKDGYDGDLNVNISGGTITSAHGYALREYVVTGETSRTQKVTISGGQLSGGLGEGDAKAAVTFTTNNDAVLDLIGGFYNTDPSAFVYIPKYVTYDGTTWYTIADMVGAVTGTVSMQGRTTRAGVPVKMTGGSVVIPTVTSTDDPGANLSFAYLVPNTTYTITTNQPRYLNITSDLLKTKLITDGTETLATFRLFGGNAIWTDNKIDLLDYGLVTGAYGSTEETDADVNFDGVVNIFDLALVAGNYGLTSQTAYANWTP